MLHPEPIQLPVAAIDIGFFSTKFTLGDGQDNQILVDQFPSLTTVPTTVVKDLAGMPPMDGCSIPLDGTNFWVGKSINQLVNSSFGARSANKNFSTTQAYKALMLGALYYICRHHGSTDGMVINQLVLGLPLTTVFTHADGLTAMASGHHRVPVPGREGEFMTVTVKSVVVISQPQGALMSLHRKLGRKITDEEVLILDMGGGTFDWLLSEGMRPRIAKSDAAEQGALACAAAICDVIDPSFKSDPNIIKRVDTVMREGAEFLDLDGERHEMAKLWPAADSLIKGALDQMDMKLGSTATIQHVWLTGGGAHLLARCIASKFPKLKSRIHEDTDPVYSNVKGFHILGQRLQRMGA